MFGKHSLKSVSKREELLSWVQYLEPQIFQLWLKILTVFTSKLWAIRGCSSGLRMPFRFALTLFARHVRAGLSVRYVSAHSVHTPYQNPLEFVPTVNRYPNIANMCPSDLLSGLGGLVTDSSVMFSAEPNATLAKTTLGIKQRAAVSARFQQLSPWARHRVLALPGTNKKVSEFTALFGRSWRAGMISRPHLGMLFAMMPAQRCLTCHPDSNL